MKSLLLFAVLVSFVIDVNAQGDFIH